MKPEERPCQTCISHSNKPVSYCQSKQRHVSRKATGCPLHTISNEKTGRMFKEKNNG